MKCSIICSIDLSVVVFLFFVLFLFCTWRCRDIFSLKVCIAALNSSLLLKFSFSIINKSQFIQWCQFWSYMMHSNVDSPRTIYWRLMTLVHFEWLEKDKHTQTHEVKVSWKGPKYISQMANKPLIFQDVNLRKPIYKRIIPYRNWYIYICNMTNDTRPNNYLYLYLYHVEYNFHAAINISNTLFI